MGYFTFNKYRQAPPTPMLPVVALPDDPHTPPFQWTTASSRPSVSQGRRTGSFDMGMRSKPGTPAPVPVSSRNYENGGTLASRGYSTGMANTHNRSISLDFGGPIPAAAIRAPPKLRSILKNRPITPVPSIAHASQEEGRRTRSISLSGRGHNEVFESHKPRSILKNRTSSSQGNEHGRSLSGGNYNEVLEGRKPRSILKNWATTPAPVASSSAQSSSLSGTDPSNSEASRNRGVRSEEQTYRSTVQKPVPHKAPLKEESVSLSWPLIKFNASQKRKIYPLVYFDVGFDPRQSENIKYRTSGLDFHSLPITDRDLPVSTHCTVTEMIIECPHIGQIVVVRQAGIRCLDVFYEIYRGYHERLGHHELPRDSQRYWPAFELRCQYGPNRDHEVRAGFRRVDLLQGKRIFDGLTRLGANWELHFQ